MKEGILVITLWQIVIRDLGTQMMDMMEPNIPAKPLQEGGQFIE